MKVYLHFYLNGMELVCEMQAGRRATYMFCWFQRGAMGGGPPDNLALSFRR